MSKPKPRAWVRISHRTKDLHPSKQKWEVLWTDPGQDFKKRTKGGFSTKRSAQEWAEQFLSDTRIGEWSDPSKVTPTFAAVAQQWIDERTFERALTEYGYRKLIDGNNELTRTFNDVEVSDITPAMVRQYVSRAAGKLSGQSVRKQFYILRWVLDQAVQDQFIRVNPARAIHRLNLPKQTTDDRRRSKSIANRRLSPEQIDALVAALPEPYDVFIRLLAYTGLRPEEAVGLTLADVDVDDPNLATVHVHAVVVSANGVLIREEVTKTPESNRVIPIRELDSSRMLTAYVAAHRKRAAKWFSEHPEHEHPGEALPLFVGSVVGGSHDRSVIDRLDYSKPMRYGQFYKRHWPKARKEAGLPETVRVYDLRHTFASIIMDMAKEPGGLTPKEAQVLLGHKDWTMLMKTYWHAQDMDDDKLKATGDAIAAAFQRTRKPTNVTKLHSKRTG